MGISPFPCHTDVVPPDRLLGRAHVLGGDFIFSALWAGRWFFKVGSFQPSQHEGHVDNGDGRQKHGKGDNEYLPAFKRINEGDKKDGSDKRLPADEILEGDNINQRGDVMFLGEVFAGLIKGLLV